MIPARKNISREVEASDAGGLLLEPQEMLLSQFTKDQQKFGAPLRRFKLFM